MTEIAELHWEQLLDFIEAGTVVPVVGRELLWTEIRGEHQDVYRYLSMRLAAELRVEPSADFIGDPVSDVVGRYLATRQDPAWPYAVVFKLAKDLAAAEPPPSLLTLAEIGFPLLVSTTFEGFLERAVDRIAAAQRLHTTAKSYFLNSDADLDPFDQADRVVFNLLGRACPTTDYALTDADVLEFIRQFHRDRPARLLATLQQKHLLVIGIGYSDWLARFFLRMARPANSRLWMNANALTHYVANPDAAENELRRYLQHPLSASKLFADYNAHEFVAELGKRWFARHPQPLAQSRLERQDRLEPPSGGVFLSYARPDSDVAEVVRDQLDKKGFDVWFDKTELHAGDDWDRKIRRAVDQSTLFVPLISQNTLTTAPDRYFRAEWRFAEIRAQRAPFNVPYVFPMIIDATNEQTTHEFVPGLFLQAQWTAAPRGDVPDDFVRRLRDSYRKLQRTEAAKA